MTASDKPNIVILGVAIGDLDFCSSFIATKRMEASALLSQIEQVGVLDPQVALVLLRLCGGFCKLVHLARSTPPSLSSQALSFLTMTSVGFSVSALVLIPLILPGNKPSSA